MSASSAVLWKEGTYSSSSGSAAFFLDRLSSYDSDCRAGFPCGLSSSSDGPAPRKAAMPKGTSALAPVFCVGQARCCSPMISLRSEHHERGGIALIPNSGASSPTPPPAYSGEFPGACAGRLRSGVSVWSAGNLLKYLLEGAFLSACKHAASTSVLPVRPGSQARGVVEGAGDRCSRIGIRAGLTSIANTPPDPPASGSSQAILSGRPT